MSTAQLKICIVILLYPGSLSSSGWFESINHIHACHLVVATTSQTSSMCCRSTASMKCRSCACHFVFRSAQLTRSLWAAGGGHSLFIHCGQDSRLSQSSPGCHAAHMAVPVQRQTCNLESSQGPGVLRRSTSCHHLYCHSTALCAS